ncbi:MAG: hypothetical protein AAGN46_01095 [Acidobacteriota bacterium]
MSERRFLQVHVFAVLISLASPAIAQHDSCAAVLVARQLVAVSESDQFLEAVAAMTDEETLRRSAEDLDIELPAVIRTNGAGWREAKKRVSQGSSRFTSGAHARSYLYEGPANGAVEAWAECMQDKKDANFFLYIPYSKSREEVAVTLYWSRGFGDPTPLKLQEPLDGLETLNSGYYTTVLSRPTVEEGPREIPINGSYPVGTGEERLNISDVVVLWPMAREQTQRPLIKLYACNGVVTASSEYCGTDYMIGFASAEIAPGAPEVREVTSGNFKFYGTSDPQHQGPTRLRGSLSRSPGTLPVYEVIGGTGVCHEWNGVLVIDQNKLKKHNCPSPKLFGYTLDPDRPRD